MRSPRSRPMSSSSERVEWPMVQMTPGRILAGHPRERSVLQPARGFVEALVR
jgi:hypothetical protein